LVLIGSFKQKIVSAIIVTVAKMICDIIALIIIYTTIIYIIIVIEEEIRQRKWEAALLIMYFLFNIKSNDTWVVFVSVCNVI